MVTNAEKQLLADGDMEKSGVTDWLSHRSAVRTKESDPGPEGDGTQILRVKLGSTYAAAYQNILTAGKTYRATGWARGDGSTGRPNLYLITGGYNPWLASTGSATWQYFDRTFVPDGTELALRCYSETGGAYAEFKDVLVTEYTGSVASAEKQLLVDGDFELAGVTNFTSSRSGVLTKQPGAAEDGTQVFRIAYGGLTYPAATQTVHTIGKTYRVTGWARGDGTRQPSIYKSLGGADIWLGTASTSWQRFDEVYTATGTLHYMRIGNSSGGGYVEFDDVQVTEYTGPLTV